MALLDADQAVTNIRSLAERVSLSLAERRFHLLLIAIFAGVAVALAVVGVHSIVAYSAGAMGLARFLESLLFEIRPVDPLTLLSCAILLAAIAFLACWLPAMRAARVDPVVALRHE